MLSGNAYINAGSYEATVSLTDAAKNNYAWETNGTKNLTFAWSISKQVLDAPVFAEKGEQGGGASLRTTYDPATTSWLLSGFDADIMGILSNTDAYYTLVDGNPAMAASDAGTHSFVFNIKASGGVYNYYWRGQEPSADGGTVSVTWTIDPFEYTVTSLQENYGVSFGDASKEYNGQEQSIAIAGSLPEGVGVEYSGSALNVTGAEGVAVTATFYNTSDNYTVKAGEDTLTATLVITPKVLTEEDLVWSGASASYTYAYMASSMLSRVTVSFTGVSGRSLPVPVKIAGYTTATGGEGELTDFENAGTYTFVLDYEAFEYGNYQLPEGVEQDYVITRRSITVYIGDQFATYNGAPQSATADSGEYIVTGTYYSRDFASIAFARHVYRRRQVRHPPFRGVQGRARRQLRRAGSLGRVHRRKGAALRTGRRKRPHLRRQRARRMELQNHRRQHLRRAGRDFHPRALRRCTGYGERALYRRCGYISYPVYAGRPRVQLRDHLQRSARGNE